MNVDWSEKAVILVSALVIYAAVVLFIRISGKRSTSQMNNFDWIVTVAMGSLASSGILLEEVSIFDALLAIALLLLAQYGLTWFSFSNKEFASIVKAEPRMLVYRGRFLREEMRKERVTEEEINSAIRKTGLASVGQVRAVILETDAGLSIIADEAKEAELLEMAAGAPPKA